MDTPIDRRRFVHAAGTALVVALAGCSSDDGSDAVTTRPTATTTELAVGTTDEATQAAENTEGTADETTEETTEETTAADGRQGFVRAAHASPDAPAVDVYVNDVLAFEGMAYRDVTPYAQLPPEDYDVRVTVAGDESTVVFAGTVPVEPGHQTAMAYGEAGASQGSETALAVDVFTDQSEDVGGSEALVRLFHGSPDAPAVDVTVADGGDPLFESAAFGDPTDYVAVSPGSYSLDVRPNTGDGSGGSVGTFDVTLEAGTAYSALALGYVDPPADRPELELVTTTDGPGEPP